MMFGRTTSRLRPVFATVFVLFPVLSPAIVIRDDQPDSGYLSLANAPEFGAVGSFVNDWGYNGSGTLIAPNWVLTAAHNLAAATSGTFTINGIAYASTQLIRHPSYQNGNPIGGYDVGLVQLSAAVPSLAPVTLYTGFGEVGQVVTYVGNGFTGTGLTGYRTLDNKKRAFQNVVDGDFGNPSVLLGSDFDNPHTESDNAFGVPVPLNLEGSVAPGDSGGGVFLKIDSQTYLAGVISFVAATDGNANSDYGDVNGFGRVSALHPWIMSTIPEPSTYVLLTGFGLLLLAARRSKKRVSRTGRS
jgi:Trypsin/PEP-CTERM motif